MLEDGYSNGYIHKHYGIGHSLLSVLWRRYQKEGCAVLKKKTSTRATAKIKLKAILDYEKKHLPLVDVMSKYDISESALLAWCRKYHSGGVESLRKKGTKVRPPVMGRPKKKTVEEMTELERLQKENQELKTEIALLKKVRALVEERNARLREIGHGPSKN
ncbi:MAG: helix-turn-helix domain-containing protein [Paludibacteraceae bacterium]|nr:helix-turn-helix domain-containing protein [Paludibacteraceae bacterium]